jgi:hypothetical protein
MTAVVAIQPAMSRPGLAVAPPRPHSSQPMTGKENQNPAKSTSSLAGANTVRSRRERPCDACRRRKSRCVIHEGAVLCVLCEFHRQVSHTTPKPMRLLYVESNPDVSCRSVPSYRVRSRGSGNFPRAKRTRRLRKGWYFVDRQVGAYTFGAKLTAA